MPREKESFMKPSMPTHHGACHCGRLAFTFEADIGSAMTCNCSICHRVGAVWHGLAAECFHVLQGMEQAGIYQFGSMTAKHYFCTNCGVHPFIRPRLAPHAWAVNLRCVSGVDLSRVVVERFDGMNWESAAENWLRRRRSRV